MHEGHRERLKERFLENGLAGFADHEVLELLLCFAIPRKDVNPLAHELIQTFGSISGVLNAHPLDLMAVNGVGRNSATLIALIRQVQRRMRLNAAQSGMIGSPQTAVNYLCALFSGSKTERFYVLMLNSQHRLKYAMRITEGTVNQSTIYPRTVVEGALRHGAAAVILAHNHPSGDIEPSAEDIETTEKMQAALASIGIRMLEHFVVAEESAFAIIRNKAYQYSEEAQQHESETEHRAAATHRQPKEGASGQVPLPGGELLQNDGSMACDQLLASEHEGVLSAQEKLALRKLRGGGGQDDKGEGDDGPLLIEELEPQWFDDDDIFDDAQVMENPGDGWDDV